MGFQKSNQQTTYRHALLLDISGGAEVLHHGFELGNVDLSVCIFVELLVQNLNVVHAEFLVGEFLNGALNFRSGQVSCKLYRVKTGKNPNH